PVELPELVENMRASADGLKRGGEPIAMFIAVLDAEEQSLAWACAGHQGGYTVGPIAYELVKFPMGSMTGSRPKPIELGSDGGEAKLPHDYLLVVASTAVRGDDEDRWRGMLVEQAAAGPRLAQVLVDAAQKRGDLHEDFLAVVVRQRPDRRSEPVMSLIR
ncbi:MAG: hypothetical protein H0T46_16830, partial [Deltaproteobacteria bacterium]|nr:hypothetical protein [Deltaproteobacteria bacterium]